MNRYHRCSTPCCLLVATALAACQLVAPIQSPVAFAFKVGASSTIAVSVRNRSDDVVFLSRCGDHMLPEMERRSGDAWVNAAAAICPAILPMAPISLGIGAVYQDIVTVTQPGTYRLRLAIMRHTTARSESVVSQSFSVE
jgi:hypothetical protein